MKVASKLNGVLGTFVAFAIAGACSPTVTVSRDDEDTGGEGGMETTSGGSAGAATGGRGHAGDATEPVAGSAPVGGAGGDASVAGSGNIAGHGGDWSIAGNGNIAGFGGDWSLGGGAGTTSGECPCSRRPGAPVSRNCPRGAGVSASETVGPTGGELALSGTASTVGVPFRVRVFAGSLGEDTELTVSELTLPPPEDYFDFSPVYRLEPDELDFENGGEVSVPWQVPSGQVPSDLALYYAESPDGPFERMADDYQNAGFSQATLLRSGYFFVGARKSEDFEHCP